MGIIVEKVLTNDYRFNPEYQKAIEGKKVADQQVEKNKSPSMRPVKNTNANLKKPAEKSTTW
jgi:hypothetical protein